MTRSFGFSCLPLAVLVGIVLAAPGCRSSSGVPQDAASAPADGVPPDFRLVFGEGGGVTGQWTGYTVEADGTLLAWNGPVAEAGTRKSGRLAAGQVDSIWREAQRIALFDQKMDERGNMTAFMRLTADSVEHRVAFVPGVAALEKPRTPVEALYRRCRALADSVASKQ